MVTYWNKVCLLSTINLQSQAERVKKKLREARLDQVGQIDHDTRDKMLKEYLNYYRDGVFTQRRAFYNSSKELPPKYKNLARFAYNL